MRRVAVRAEDGKTLIPGLHVGLTLREVVSPGVPVGAVVVKSFEGEVRVAVARV